MRKMGVILILAALCFSFRPAVGDDSTKLPTEPMVQSVDCSKVDCSDVGISRSEVKITLPPACKMMMLTRCYRHGQLDTERPARDVEYIPSRNDHVVNLSLAAFNPDAINPQPSDKIKVTLGVSGANFPEWFTVDSQRKGISCGDGFPSQFNLQKNYALFTLLVSDFELDTHGQERAPDLKITVMVRLEPIQQSKLQDGSQVIAVNADKFPHEDGDDN